MKLKTNNNDEEEYADLSEARQKEIILKPSIIRLQPTILGYSYNLDHYVLIIEYFDDSKKYDYQKYNKSVLKDTENKEGVDITDGRSHSSNSSSKIQTRNNFNNKTKCEKTVIDLYKITKVYFIEESLILYIDTDSSSNDEWDMNWVGFKCADKAIGVKFEAALKYMVNLVKLKALIYKVKNSIT